MRTRAPARLAALLALILLVLSNLVLPAGAHVTRKLPHLLGHLDPRYIDVTEKAADANLLDGQDSSAFLGANDQAADANLLDGQDSTGFLGASAKAADAEQLDGIDSTGFVRGNFVILRRAIAIDPTFVPHQHLLGPFNDPNAPSPNVQVGYRCPSNLADNGAVSLFNSGTETLNVFSDNGGTNPNDYRQLGPSSSFEQPAAATGEHITLQIQGAGMAHIDVFSVHRASDCHAQAVGVFG